jgi:cobalt-zinc-cadmium resistance protein CzcA
MSGAAQARSRCPPVCSRRWAPTGARRPDLLVHAESTNPAYDVMEKKSLEDWSSRSQFKQRQGRRRCLQLRRPDARNTRSSSIPTSSSPTASEHRPGRAADRQQQHQRRRQLHRAGRAADQRAVGRPLHQRARHRKHRHQDAERRADLRRIRATSPPCRRGRRFASARSAAPGIIPMARSSTTRHGRRHCAAAEGRRLRPVLQGIHAKVEELNEHILPKGVKIVPFLDRSELVSYTRRHRRSTT